MTSEAGAVVLALIGLLGGVFGKTLLDRWFDRDKQMSEQSGAQRLRTFADNEEARVWLRQQLDERDEELRQVRVSERTLFTEVGELRSQVARQEERTNAQTLRIDDLSATVARLGADYAEMKAERDAYRQAKHDAENKLTAESMRRQLMERDLVSKDQEIERLRGQLEMLTTKEDQ